MARQDFKGGDAGESTQGLSIEGLWGLFGRNTRLFVVCGSLAIVASLVVASQREPSYRARATLILEDASSSQGLLGELALLGRAPQASSQIELLRARSTAEDVVSRAREPEDVTRRLGLTTIVQDPLLAPITGDVANDEPDGKLPPRLRADISPENEFDAPEKFEVEFLEATRVRVRVPGLLGAKHEGEFELAGGGELELAGCRIRLEPEGDLTGRTFRLRRFTRDEAIERVMGRTRIRETERNSGVIELTVDDSDPRRAAEIANALCLTYLERSESRGARKATSTLGFIRSSLKNQSELLREAEGEVVDVQRDNPRAINVTKSGEILIEQLSGLEVQRMQAQLAREATRGALALLSSGDLAGISRMSGELNDPVTVAYLESVAKLDAEDALQDRSDSGQYKLLLQQHELDAQASLELIERELGKLRESLTAVAARDVAAIARLGGGPPSARDPLLESYLESLGSLQARHAELALEATPEHPARIEAERRIDATIGLIEGLLRSRIAGQEAQERQQLALVASYRERRDGFPAEERTRIAAAREGLKERVREHLAGRQRGLEASLADLGAEIERVEQSLGRLPEEERVVAEPLRKLAAHTEIVKLLLAREQEAEITRASTQPAAEFVDPAVAPLDRSAPSVPLHVVVGTLLGLLVAGGVSVAKEALFRGIFTESELEAATDLPVLGAVPDFRRGRYRVRNATQHFVPLRDDPEGPCAEAYRSLRANLKFALSADGDVRSIAATSCTPGEGKSSSNVALAMAFARSGRRVVLIDCDMRRPTVHLYLGLDLGPGMSDVLEGRVPWQQALRPAVNERLDVITAGPHPRSPSDLLDSPQFKALLAELEGAYDLVVCDVPPAMAVSDMETCAAHLDALLLVVRSDKASARLVEQATRRLKQTGANLIGAVLNGVGTSLANGKYGNGYGYGYGKRDDERRAG